MSELLNALGQLVGAPLLRWIAPPLPPKEAHAGRFCRTEPLDAARHAAALSEAYAADADGRMWTYLPYGPFASADAYRGWVEERAAESDPSFYAVVDRATDRAVGVVAYQHIDPPNGVIELGHLAFAPALRGTPAGTEAMYLMLSRAFALGYRRVEWKCDALNQASRRAAERFGFTFEGIFRQHMVVKGRNRDTAWYSLLDTEWPATRRAFESWLSPRNFDGDNKQRCSLSSIRNGVL